MCRHLNQVGTAGRLAGSGTITAAGSSALASVDLGKHHELASVSLGKQCGLPWVGLLKHVAVASVALDQRRALTWAGLSKASAMCPELIHGSTVIWLAHVDPGHIKSAACVSKF